MNNFNITLLINLKRVNNIHCLTSLIEDSCYNCNASCFYIDHELIGINKYISKNNRIINIIFTREDDLCNFIKFIKTQKYTEIESIYDYDDILYYSKNYIKNIDNNFNSINNIDNITKIENLKKNYSKIYTILPISHIKVIE
jgi:hypothetical protein|tara:strand:- start:1256 stop:1681 length:426 start_codon:yes stop_codon:yes gene_type:complete